MTNRELLEKLNPLVYTNGSVTMRYNDAVRDDLLDEKTLDEVAKMLRIIAQLECVDE